MVPAELRGAAEKSRQADRRNRRDYRERMADAADDRAQAERDGPGRTARHFSRGSHTRRYARAGRPRTKPEPRDRIPGISRGSRSPRSDSEKSTPKNLHSNLRGHQSLRLAIDYLANSGESTQAPARAAQR